MDVFKECSLFNESSCVKPFREVSLGQVVSKDFKVKIFALALDHANNLILDILWSKVGQSEAFHAGICVPLDCLL